MKDDKLAFYFTMSVIVLLLVIAFLGIAITSFR